MRLAPALRLACAAALASLAFPAAAQLDPDRLAGLRARNIGPAGMSGRITAVAAVASQPRIVYVGAATGGVWKSESGGLTWQSVFDDQPVHAIGALAVFQANPQLVWVGTGEGNVRNSVSVGNGVYRSLDGGKTWQHLGLEKTERIYRVLLHPAEPDVAYACALGQEWGENPERGVFKTQDGGRSWKKVLYVNEKTGCGELAMDPRNPGKLIAGMWEFRRWPWFFKSGGPGSGMYVTHDGGLSWKRLQEEDGLPKGELGRMGIAFSPSNPEIVYAVVEAETSALLRSENGGRSFAKVNEKASVAPRPFYFADLRVDPAWPNRVYSLDYEVRVSNDSGKTWSALPGASWAQIHGDHHAMWINPNDPGQILVGNDGGLAESRDRGQTFRFVGNLPLAQYYHVAVDDELPYNVYGGLQDNGSWRGPSSVWRDGGIRNYDFAAAGGGDGFETLPHPKDPQQGYSLWQGGNLMRFDLRTGATRIVKPAPPEGTRLRFNWNAALSTDPFEPDTVYLGSQFVHRSRDRGETWEVLSPDLTSNSPEWQKQDESGGLTRDVTAAENFTTLVSIAPSAVERGVIWTGSDDGRIHVTRDGGKTWTSVEKNVAGVPAGTWVPHVEASPHDPGTAFAVFDNHRRSDFSPYAYRTDDFGKTWRRLSSPEIRGYALVLRQDPVKKDLLFLGTEFGLFASFDGGARWTHLKKALPTASVMDLKVHPREHDLVIGTHGRALWVLDDIRPLRALSEAALQEPLRFFEVADTQQYWSRQEEGGFGYGAAEFRGTNRPYGAILTYALNLPDLPVFDEEKERERKEKARQDKREKAEKEKAAARPGDTKADDKKADAPKGDEDPKVEITVTDAAGRKIRTFKAPARLGVNRAVWNLRRDAFRQTPRAEDAPPPDEDPSGPELPPGVYTVTLKLRDHEAKQSVRVVADPRSRNGAADWQRRYEAIEKSGALWDTAVDAIWRVRRTRDDVQVVERKLREAAEAAGERDPKKLEENPLMKAGSKLKEGLAELEKRLWQSPDRPGILPETDVLTQIAYPIGFIQSSWDPPSPTQLEYLRQAGLKLADCLKDVNAFFDKDVAAYRKQVEDAKIGLLPAAAPIEVGPKAQ